MARSYIIVAIGQRARMRRALLGELASRLGRPVATQGYTGMASAGGGGVLMPPGKGETLQAIPERVSRDGIEVAFVLDGTDSVGLQLMNPITKRVAMRMRDVAGTTLGTVDVPAREDKDENYFPDPSPDAEAP